jgi:catabolite regulation protein CreA
MKYESRNFHEPEEITCDTIGNPKIKNQSDIISSLVFQKNFSGSFHGNVTRIFDKKENDCVKIVLDPRK